MEMEVEPPKPRDEHKVLVPRTTKERVFEYLEKHPTMSMPGIYIEFTTINKATLRCYKREFDLFQQNKISNFIKEIETLLYLLTHKYQQKKNTNLTQTEERSIEKLSLLVEEHQRSQIRQVVRK